MRYDPLDISSRSGFFVLHELNIPSDITSSVNCLSLLGEEAKNCHLGKLKRINTIERFMSASEHLYASSKASLRNGVRQKSKVPGEGEREILLLQVIGGVSGS